MKRLSVFEYNESLHIAAQSYSFYSLIAAAMRQAGTQNLDLLRAGWPGIYESLVRRRNAPGGIVPEWDAPEERQ